MSPILLQWLAGGLYFLNKVLLQFSETKLEQMRFLEWRVWRIRAWVVYLFGLPFWLAIFAIENNWIALSVEAAGGPAMVLGLVTSSYGTAKNPPKWLDRLTVVCAALGLGVSIWDFGGLTTLNQWLEIALVAGYLIGTRDLALERIRGYLWFVLMHIACAMLMHIEHYPLLFWFQIASLLIIVRAFLIAYTDKNQGA